MRAHWPQARVGAAAVAGQSVELGADSSLQAVAAEAGSLAFVLREERTLVGAAAHDALAMGAPARRVAGAVPGFHATPNAADSAITMTTQSTQQLEAAIAALEAQRALLGDNVATPRWHRCARSWPRCARPRSPRRRSS